MKMTTLRTLQDLAVLNKTTDPCDLTHTIWAMLEISSDSEQAIREYLLAEIGLRSRFVRRNLHMSIYHARRPLPGVADHEEPFSLEIEAKHFRLMAMAPGGENPRPDIDMTRVSIGLRLQRATPALVRILDLRRRFYPIETAKVLGRRLPSNHRRSAFGARSFQPHINLLRGGSGVNPDLTVIGAAFRAGAPALTFDRFVIRCRSTMRAAPADDAER